MHINITKYSPAHWKSVVDLWEQSVRATHDFLSPPDIEFFKSKVLEIDFTAFDVYCAFTAEKELVGILGTDESRLEMLFLKPSAMGIGVGRQLMDFALTALGVTSVEVNESNRRAVTFYEKFGFRIHERIAHDAFNKPYPTLRMNLVCRNDTSNPS